MINVMVVEDQAMPRQLFESIIASSGRYSLVHSIKNADMADIYCEKSEIDLILMDVCTAMNSSGLEATKRIKSKYPAIKIIIVTSMPEVSFIKRAREAVQGNRRTHRSGDNGQNNGGRIGLSRQNSRCQLRNNRQRRFKRPRA